MIPLKVNNFNHMKKNEKPDPLQEQRLPMYHPLVQSGNLVGFERTIM